MKKEKLSSEMMDEEQGHSAFIFDVWAHNEVHK